MISISRRDVCLAGIVSTLAPASALGGATGVAFPDGPMHLERKIERGLSDGEKIIVERSWQVQFARQGLGLSISGRQTDVDVAAPAALSSLVEIERGRATEGMFPILLSETGLLVAAGRSLLEEDMERAMREAQRMIERRNVSAETEKAQLHGLSILQRNAGRLLDEMPADLFFPVSPPMRASQPVDLGDGLEGEFEVTYEATRTPNHAWLNRAERTVTTRIGDSERRSREVWAMTAI